MGKTYIENNVFELYDNKFYEFEDKLDVFDYIDLGSFWDTIMSICTNLRYELWYG